MNTKQLILQLVSRSLILSKEVIERVKEEVAFLTEGQMEELLDVLRGIDNRQTEILEKQLEEEPWLFTKLENVASKELYKEHLEEEYKEIADIEEEFITALNNL